MWQLYKKDAFLCQIFARKGEMFSRKAELTEETAISLSSFMLFYIVVVI